MECLRRPGRVLYVWWCQLYCGLHSVVFTVLCLGGSGSLLRHCGYCSLCTKCIVLLLQWRVLPRITVVCALSRVYCARHVTVVCALILVYCISSGLCTKPVYLLTLVSCGPQDHIDALREKSGVMLKELTVVTPEGYSLAVTVIVIGQGKRSVRARVHACACVCLCVFVCVRVCMCVFIGNPPVSSFCPFHIVSIDYSIYLSKRRRRRSRERLSLSPVYERNFSSS